jgi:hypothetical protein
MSFFCTKNVGFGLIGAGGAVAGAAMVPEGTNALPPGATSATMMVGGIGMMGVGSALAIMGGKD